MIDLGVGARSYTADTHYLRDFAVLRRGVLSIIGAYCNEDRDAFAHAHQGCDPGEGDAVRRYAMKSILNRAGLDIALFIQLIGAGPLETLLALGYLLEASYLARNTTHLVPTVVGLEWLESARTFIRSISLGRMDAFEVA